MPADTAVDMALPRTSQPTPGRPAWWQAPSPLMQRTCVGAPAATVAQTLKQVAATSSTHCRTQQSGCSQKRAAARARCRRLWPLHLRVPASESLGGCSCCSCAALAASRGTKLCNAARCACSHQDGVCRGQACKSLLLAVNAAVWPQHIHRPELCVSRSFRTLLACVHMLSAASVPTCR